MAGWVTWPWKKSDMFFRGWKKASVTVTLHYSSSIVWGRIILQCVGKYESSTHWLCIKEATGLILPFQNFRYSSMEFSVIMWLILSSCPKSFLLLEEQICYLIYLEVPFRSWWCRGGRSQRRVTSRTRRNAQAIFVKFWDPNGSPLYSSMDWLKGKSTGNHGFYHQI